MSQMQSQELAPQAILQRPHDEIDLVDLFAKIWQRKWWVVAITALAAALAAVNVMTAKPVYRAEVFLMPPTSSDLQALNVTTGQLVHKITPDTAYKRVLEQLRSKQQLKEFIATTSFAQAYRSSDNQSDRQVFKAFAEALSVRLPKKGDLVFASISLEGPGAELAAEALNSYVEKVQNKVVNDLRADIIEARDRKLELLQSLIESKRQIAKLQREDRIILLEEALTIATAVGIDKLGSNGSNAASSQNINIVNTAPLFMRGSDTLAAEIRVLKARTSDDPSIGDLRRLQEESANLKALKIDPSALTPMHIDLKAVAPEQPIKPKKRLIVAVAIMLGGVLGVLVALVVPVRREKNVA